MERTQPSQVRPLPRQNRPARRHQIGNRNLRLQTLKVCLANPRRAAASTKTGRAPKSVKRNFAPS